MVGLAWLCSLNLAWADDPPQVHLVDEGFGLRAFDGGGVEIDALRLARRLDDAETQQAIRQGLGRWRLRGLLGLGVSQGLLLTGAVTAVIGLGDDGSTGNPVRDPNPTLQRVGGGVLLAGLVGAVATSIVWVNGRAKVLRVDSHYDEARVRLYAGPQSILVTTKF